MNKEAELRKAVLDRLIAASLSVSKSSRALAMAEAKHEA